MIRKLGLGFLIVVSSHFAYASQIPQDQIDAFLDLMNQYPCRGIEDGSLKDYKSEAATRTVAFEINSSFNVAFKTAKEDQTFYSLIKLDPMSDTLERRFRMTMWGANEKTMATPIFDQYLVSCSHRIDMALAYISPKFSDKLYPNGIGNAYQTAVAAADWTGGMADLDDVLQNRPDLAAQYILGWINVMVVRDKMDYPMKSAYGRQTIRRALNEIHAARKIFRQMYKAHKMSGPSYEAAIKAQDLAEQIATSVL